MKKDDTSDAGLVVVVEEKKLTRAESNRLEALETAIGENFLGFVIVGLSLAEINERRLYRTREGRTFDEYCAEILDLSVRRSYQLIEASMVMENVKNFSHSGTQVIDIVIPQNEAQAKELAKLKPEEQGQVWAKLVKEAGENKVKITAARVKKEVCEYRGEKLQKVIKATTSPLDKEKNIKMSKEFSQAWDALWSQVEKEQKANWRYTSKGVVYDRLTILLEAVEEAGVQIPGLGRVKP